jgi:hypothetical protein
MAKQEIGFTPAWQNRCQAIVIGVDKRHQYYSGDREFLLSRPGIFGFAGGKLTVVSTTTAPGWFRVNKAALDQNASWKRLINTFSSCRGVTVLSAILKFVCS